MKQKAFFIFAAIVTVLIVAATFFIQSPYFAKKVKELASQHIPKDMGLTGDFEEFAIKLFPPGVSIRKPRLIVHPRNILNLPADTSVSAEEIDLSFRPFQMLSGDIRVKQVTVIRGEINLPLDKMPVAQKKPAGHLLSEFHWDELLQIHAEAIAIQDTHIHLSRKEGAKSDPSALSADLVAENLRLAQWSGKGGLGYELVIDLKDFHAETSGSTFAIPAIEHLGITAHLNALGASVERISFRAQGMEGSGQGNIRGDVTKGKNLGLDGNVEISGDLEKFLSLLNKSDSTLPSVSGTFSFRGKAQGNLENLRESLKIQGNLKAKDLDYKAYHFDEVQAEGEWLGTRSGGEIALSRALLQSAPRARVGGHQSASGGKIEIGAVRIPLDGASEVTVPLKLERAHIQWLAAIAPQSVYPLDCRISGTINTKYSPKGTKKSWEIISALDLKVVDFQLDNQRLGQEKPMHRVLKIPEFKLAGNARVDSFAVNLDGIALSVGRTQLKTQGKIDYKTGWELRADGPANLADLVEISENTIRGEGTLKAHVHGPTSRVFLDFDLDVKDALYLGLELGSLKGRITWDDDPSRLLFTDVELKKNTTSYTGNGVIDLGKQDRLGLNFSIPQGNIQDLIQIFRAKTLPFWWFPQTLAGNFSGTVLVGGGVSEKGMQLAAKINGKDWQFYGEHFKTVNFLAGFDRGKYYLNDARITKRLGRIAGQVSYDQNDFLSWAFQSQDFTIGDLDHLARLDVPLRGRLDLQSAGSGNTGHINSSTLGQLGDLVVRGVGLPSSQLTIKTAQGVAKVQASVLGGQAVLDGSYDFNPKSKSNLKAEFKHFDFSPILLLLNPKLIQDTALAGVLSGNANLNFRAGEVELANGKLELSEYSLAKSGARFQITRPVATKVADGNFDLTGLALRGVAGEAKLDLHGRNAKISGAITGDIDVSLVEFITSTVAASKGTADLDYVIGGSLKEPKIYGKANLNSVSFQIPSLESTADNLTGIIQLRQNRITAQNLTGDLAGGRILAEGTIDLFVDKLPVIDLHGSVAGSRLKIYPFQFVKMHGPINLHGNDLPYIIDGDIVVDSALSKQNVFNQKQGEGLRAVQYTPPVSSQKEGDYPKFKLDIDVQADRNILVQNDLFSDVELKAKLKIVNTLEAPRLLGTAEVIQGKMVFKDHSFQIQSATATFDNPTVSAPVFNLTATTDVNNIKVQLYAAGRLPDRWKIDLTSNPTLPESELISLLAIGITSDDTRKFSSSDRSVFEQGAAASLVLHSFDFNREVQDKTGLRIQLDESVNLQQGTSVFRAQSSTDSTAAPRIIIKRQLGSNVDVSYGSTVGVGTNFQREVNTEVHVTPGFSVIGVWDNYETDAQDNRTSYGLDLKLQKRFK